MKESEKLALTAAVTLSVLPRPVLGAICIELAQALCGAMVCERRAKGEPEIPAEEVDSAISQFILLAARDCGVTVKGIPTEPTISSPGMEPEKDATPEQNNAAQKAVADLLSRLGKH